MYEDNIGELVIYKDKPYPPIVFFADDVRTYMVPMTHYKHCRNLNMQIPTQIRHTYIYEIIYEIIYTVYMIIFNIQYIPT